MEVSQSVSQEDEEKTLSDEEQRAVVSLCLLAGEQSEAEEQCGHGACIVSPKAAGQGLEIVSLGSHGKPNGISFHDSEIDDSTLCHAVMNAIVSAGRHQAEIRGCSCYYTKNELCHDCKKMISLSGMKGKRPGIDESEATIILVDLERCTASEKTEGEIEKYRGRYENGAIEMIKKQQPTFFPMAEDDYFMTVAILSGKLSEKDNEVKHEQSEKYFGACIATHEPPRVVSIGYKKESCAEKCAISNAYRSRVDLTKCILYTTHHPCLECTKVILQAGIRVVIWGRNDDQMQETDKDTIDDMVYRAKICFIKYRCLIPIESKEKKFVIDLHKNRVIAKKMYPPTNKEKSSSGEPTKSDDNEHTLNVPVRRRKPTYTEFFMAMAFLASARSKNNKTQVGACIVTTFPHRMVMLSYNRMPDGRRFKDEEMDWGPDKEKYVCHAEPSAIISAFRRGCDLSSCTLYVTHSPCDHCSKVVAQSGIKNLVFASEYHKAKDAYNHLERLPGMSISQYRYREGDCGNIAKVVIDLDKLKTTLQESRAEPKSTTKLEKCQREVDFPVDDYFMAIAILATIRSDCLEPIGACIALEEPRRAISVGYNGVPSSRKDLSGIKQEKYDDYVCCAEANVILGAFRYHATLTNSILYTTSRPCPKCAQMIVQSGIKSVVCGGKWDKDTKKKEAVEEIFYRAKIALLKYKRHSKKRYIVIDLSERSAKQHESVDLVLKQTLITDYFKQKEIA